MSYKNLIAQALISIFVFVVGHYIKQIIDNKKASSRKRKAILSSLIAETECLLHLIQTRLEAAKKVKNDVKAFVTIPITGDYFRIFDSVAADLSVLNSNKLAIKAIQTYMETKGLFDDVKWFSTNAFELKRGLVLVNGNVTPLINGYIESQIIYYDEIVNDRAPKACQRLEELIQDLKAENK